MTALAPAIECRAVFSGHFYRMSSAEKADHMISPAAVLKLLITVSLGVEPSLADRIYWDLYIKHVDETRLREEAKKEGITDMGFTIEVRERLEAEQEEWFKTKEILNFFQNDFNEISDKIKIDNFIATDGKNDYKADYMQMAQEFFNVKLLKKNIASNRELIKTYFPIEVKETGLDILGSVDFKFNFQAPVRMLDDGSFEAFGEFKCGNIKNWSSRDFRTDVLELPLDGSLTMLIFIPNDFYTLLTQSIGRDYVDFKKISEKLEKKFVHVKLPKFKYDTKINLREFFAENSYRGLRDFFNEPVSFNRMFELTDNVDFEVGEFWQHTSLEISASKDQLVNSSAQPDVVFDATQKSILFVIKSEKVLYVMGHYFKGE